MRIFDFKSLRIVVSFLLLTSAFALADAGGISGRVLDPLGAFIPNAKVVALQDNKTIAETTADATGAFIIKPLPSGRYIVRATASGFSTKDSAPVIVRGTNVASTDITLAIGSIPQQVVVSATGTETPDSQLGASVTLIGTEQLQGKLNVFDALRLAAGVQGIQSGGQGSSSSIFVRGGNSKSNKVLIDGIPANDIGGTFEFANLSSAGVNTVELFRGPNSVLYGSDALASVINVTTRRGSTRLPEFTLAGSGGTFSTYDYASSLAGAYKNFDYFSEASRIDTRNNIPNSQYHNATFAGNYGWTPTGTTDLRVTVRRNASNAGLANAFDLYQIPDDSSLKEQNTFVGVTLQNQTTSKWHNLVRYGAARLTLQNDNPSVSGIPDGFGDGLGKTVTLCAPTGCAAPAQAILDFGGTYPSLFDSFTSRDFLQTQSDYTLSSHLTALFGFRFEDERGVTHSGFGDNSTSRQNYSYSIQAQGNLWTRLYATAGVGLEKNAVFGFAATPKVSLAYYLARPVNDRFFSGTKLKFNFGKGIKEPSIFDENSSLFALLSKVAPSVITQFHVAPIGPERSRSFDFGIDQAFLNRRARLGVTLFHNRFYDQIEFVDKTFLPQLGVPTSVAAATSFGADVNSADYRARGAETEIEFNLGHGFAATGTYTYTGAVVTKSFSSDNNPNFQVINSAFPGVLIGAFSPLVGARPFRIAPHSGSFALRYSRPKFTAAVNGYLVGRRDDSTFLTDAFFGNSLLLPNRNLAAGYQKIDLTGSYAIHPAVTLFTSMENLLNQRYDAAYGFPSLPFTIRTGVKFVIGGEGWKLK
ncbi:MAG: TonB-dependent receptor plug [Candidatus Angelobacter sp.]|jgi:vitamin B12 transporter|nr:TonB-dependent receptor plug [Candidatus Angelobacter sp.]